MIFVINDGGKVSLKMSFVIQSYNVNSKKNFFYIYRTNDSRFAEKFENNQVRLATSVSGNFIHLLLMFVKSPKDMRDGLMNRLLRIRRPNTLLVEGFLSDLAQVLGEYYEKSSNTKTLLNFLKNLDSPKIFLLDEYTSLRIVNLKKLKPLGSIVYVSQDVAYDHFNFGNNAITKKLMYKLEHNAMNLVDLVIASSERDRLKYLEMGAKQAIFYPNLYPAEFEQAGKDPEPSISIVLHSHWGQEANRSLNEIFKALAYSGETIKVNLIGISARKIPKNIKLQHYEHIPSKTDYLKILSSSWIGINVGIHLGGSNERKYDYAMAGLVVFSDTLGARGDLLPNEYTYVDSYDLAGKIKQLLKFKKEAIVEMGKQNQKQALFLAETQRNELLKTLNHFS
jgi:hypothetical protein